MKTNHTNYKQIKQIISIVFILYLFNSNIYSQTMDLYDVEYHNTQIPHCSPINLNFGPEHYITFKVHFEKAYYGDPSTDLIDIAGDVFIELGARGGGTILFSSSIDTNSWIIDGNYQYFELTGSVSISNSQLNDYGNGGGGILSARYSSTYDYESCDYDITRPEYILSPSSSSISCGQSNAVFNVSDVHNSIGYLVYHWSVGTGWKNTNGDIIINDFTTNSSSLNIIPYQFPPSDIHVTPELDGVLYDELISTVSLSEISTNFNISGNSSVCTTGVYSIDNMPSNWNVAWNTNSSNASLNTLNNHQVEVTVSGNSGVFTLNATITNPCGQTKSANPKTIHFGRPARPSVIYGPTNIHADSYIRYRIDPVANATSYEWRLPYPYTVVNYFNGNSRNWQLQNSGSHSTNINAFTGTDGNSGYVQVWGKNQCGNGAARYIRVSQGSTNDGSGPNAGQYKNLNKDNFDKYFSIFPNPANKNVVINKLVKSKNPDMFLELYDMQGFLIKKFDFNLENIRLNTEKYKDGVYIFKAVIDGTVFKKKLIIKH